MRLVTYMQTHHQFSRRLFISLINQGCVFLNNKLISTYTQEVIPGDKLLIKSVNGTINETIGYNLSTKKTIIIFNKPMGYVVSKHDPYNKTIYDILPSEYHNYYYIGRLDKDSHGLVLLTNDPALVNEYEHPKYGIEKEYIIKLDKMLNRRDIQRILSGIIDENEFLKVIKITQHKKQCHYTVVLNEGKKRHIRRMFKAIGYYVMDLQRIREGKYKLGNIKTGERKII